MSQIDKRFALALLVVVAASSALFAADDDADETTDTGVLTPGNILISRGGDSKVKPSLFEFTPDGKEVRVIRLPAKGWNTSQPHDVVIGSDGRAHFFQGVGDGKFAAWNPRNGNVAVKRHEGMSIPNEAHHGAVAALKPYVFAVSLGNTKGIVRFNLETNEVKRFEGFDPLDLAGGFNGTLYSLEADEKTVHLIDPDTMAKKKTVQIGGSRAIAVDRGGQIWAAGRDGNLTPYALGRQSVTARPNIKGIGDAHDLDIAPSGLDFVLAVGQSEIVVVGRYDEAIKSKKVTRFKVNAGSTLFVSFVQDPPVANKKSESPPEVAVVPPKVDPPSPDPRKVDPPQVGSKDAPPKVEPQPSPGERRPVFHQPTPGHILVTRKDRRQVFLSEYDAKADRVQNFEITTPKDTAGTPDEKRAADLALGSDTKLYFYHGVFRPVISVVTFDQPDLGAMKADGLSLVGNARYGAIAALGEYIFAGDCERSGDRTAGIVRFKVADGTWARFSEGTEPFDLAAGHDGLLYELRQQDGDRVFVWHPEAMRLMRSISLEGGRVRGIAVDKAGRIFASVGGGVSQFDPSGKRTAHLAIPGPNLFDIDVSLDGQVVVTEPEGRAYLIDRELREAKQFEKEVCFVAFADWPVPVTKLPAPTMEPDAAAKMAAEQSRPPSKWETKPSGDPAPSPAFVKPGKPIDWIFVVAILVVLAIFGGSIGILVYMRRKRAPRFDTAAVSAAAAQAPLDLSDVSDAPLDLSAAHASTGVTAAPPIGAVLQTIALTAYDKDRKPVRWTLDLMDDRAVVRDQAGNVIEQIAAVEANAKIELPSFSKSIKHLLIKSAQGLLTFDIAKPDIEPLRDFMARGVAAGGPKAVQASFNAALRDTAIGVVVTVVAVAIMLSNLSQSAETGGKGRIGLGLVIFGLVMLGKGVYGFSQHAKVKAMSKEK